MNKTKLISKILIILCGILFILSIFSYHPQDPSIFVYSNQKVSNLCGIIGATIADILFQTFGLSAYIISFLILISGIYYFLEKYSYKISDIILSFLFVILSSSFLQLILPDKISFYEKDFIPGGIAGKYITYFFIKYFNIFGAFLIIFTLLIVISIALFNISIKVKVPSLDYFKFKKFLKKDYRENKIEVEEERELLTKIYNNKENFRENNNKKKIPKPKKPKNGYIPPSTNLLSIKKEKNKIEIKENLEEKANILIEKFKDFNINGEIVNIVKGPAVTLFEFKPDPGIKLSKITSLQNDIKMALKAKSVRIVAPIPGKDVVGIEVSNEKRETVYLKEIVESEEFKTSSSPLTLGIGKTIDGQPYISDLKKMPHLLVAGSTGSGKSVCINVLINSILFKSSFEDVRFILIDPKKLELSFYNEIPHLLLPVISEPDKALIALKWAIYEMERRYDIMTQAGVRDITQYNNKISHNKLPYIVIIIDELADLMMIASKEMETLIARLTQKARAAGIHMILATQRPSVDVITGIIKNNLPSRIAFKVTTRADSRTILDHMGAESLLGMGDMLFLPPGSSNVVRLQGAFISEEEIIKIIEYLKRYRDKVEYLENEILSFNEDNLKKDYSIDISGLNSNDYDPLWKEAVEFVSQLNEVSISLLQRKFKIGYNRAAKIIEKMEEEGIVGPADGSKPRKVLIK